MPAARTAVVCTIVALLAALATAPAGAGVLLPVSCTDFGTHRVCFNDPRIPERGDDLLDDLILQIDQVRLTNGLLGARSIRVAMFDWGTEGQGVQDALIAADRDGVDVRVVVDQATSQARVDAMSSAGISIRKCQTGTTTCVRSGGIMHNKFALLSTPVAKNVWQSSGNFLLNSGVRYFNDSLLVRNDTALFGLYNGYFDALYNRTAGSLGTTHGAGSTPLDHAYFFPQNTDRVLEVLNSTQCAAADRVWISVSLFNAGQRSSLVNRLAALQDAGCDVKVIVQEYGQHSELESVLRRSPLGDSVVKYTPDAAPLQFPIHHKFMVVDAMYQGLPTKMVLTGSHNYNGPAVSSNGEAIVRTMHPGVVALYAERFLDLWTAVATT